VTLNDISERKRAEEVLKRSEQQLRGLAARLQQAREDERAFIAREIHDELGQLLTGLKFDIKWLEKRLPLETEDAKDAGVLRAKTASLLELVDETIRALRRIATEFRPGLLDTLGLIAAIEWQAEEFRNRTGITCQIGEKASHGLSDRDRETALFRIFQEALTNVARHANATRVLIELVHVKDVLRLTVSDNGKGMGSQPGTTGIGLAGMRARARVARGTVSVESRPGEGVRIRAEAPLRQSRYVPQNPHTLSR